MSSWISLTVFATVVALGSGDGAEPMTEIELHVGRHETREECALASVRMLRPDHVDVLTSQGSRVRCLERAKVRQRCFHAQVSVVRDHDRSLAVDVEVEPDLGSAPDSVQQHRAAGVRGLEERGAILARWPVGAWHDYRVCLDEDGVLRRRIHVPARCILLLGRYAGKPHLAWFHRAGEQGCVVAVNPGQKPVALDVSIPPPAEGETRGHFRFGNGEAFPGCVAPGSTVRRHYRFIGEWAQAWHVRHILVLGGAPKGDCLARP